MDKAERQRLADRIYQASGLLWSVANALREAGMTTEADAVQKAAVYSPIEIAAQLEGRDI